MVVQKNRLGHVNVDDLVVIDVQGDSQLDTTNVVLGEDLVFSGDYTLGLKKPTAADTWTAPKGMTLHEMFVQLFTGTAPDAQPVITEPSVTLTVTGVSDRMKVGETCTVGYRLDFDPGIYTTTLGGISKTQSTNVLPVSFKVQFYGQTLTGQSGTFLPVTLRSSDVGQLTITAEVSHSSGDLALTYNGVVTDKRIQEGSVYDFKSFTCYEEDSLVYILANTGTLEDLQSVTDDNIGSLAQSKYGVLPTKFPFEIDGDKKTLAVYVKKTEFINSITINDSVELSKYSQYATASCDCFAIYGKYGITIPNNSSITYN